MMIIGQKLGQTQKFLSDGTRIPVTVVATPGNPVVQLKSMDKDGYVAMQLGFGQRKISNKPQLGHSKKAHLTKAPKFLTEVRITEKEAATLPQVGDILSVETVLAAGDIVDVRGKSKGKGFAGGVKRHGFHGGPKTHGQSDRWRAPGSIGSGTTPGRVYRGKRMAGKMGNDMTTLKNLEVVEVGKDFVWIKGVVPGPVGAVVVVTSTGKKKKNFVGILKNEETEGTKVPNETNVEPVEEVKGEQTKMPNKAVKPEPKEEIQPTVIASEAKQSQKGIIEETKGE